MGVSGAGGGELLRFCVTHPGFQVVRGFGESSVGTTLGHLYQGLRGQALGDLVIEAFDPERLDDVDLLFASLPTGKSREPLARVPPRVKVVDVGGDHRYVEGWTYGLPELPSYRERIRRATRVANTGCYASAALIALAPLVAQGLIEPEGIVVDGKSGVSGAGRGGSSSFGYIETNEDLFAYGLVDHPHVREMTEALSEISGRRASLAFTPHLVPMTRGILATCYGRPHRTLDTEDLLGAAQDHYQGEPFVRIMPHDNGRGAHTKWATGSNLCFLTYAVNPATGLAVATAAIDNLGKGAAGQAIQNANLMFGLAETAGLTGAPLWI
jgi:N-acetyl-gamma-glutamyl-phosphate reductase